MRDQKFQYEGRRLPAISFLGILFACFFIMLVVAGIAQGITGAIHWSERTALLVNAALQGILVFMVPAYAYAACAYRHPAVHLGLAKAPALRAVSGIIIVFLIGMPALNQLIYWNDSITLPESMSGLETSLREMEDTARGISMRILSTDNVLAMICNVLVIGCITGLCEELFFRGSLQQILLNGNVPKGISIWVTAFVFSLLHFQFFGFFPRLLLGAFFGYLVVWSGSLWTSVIAHAFNNSIVVISSWMMTCGYISSDIDGLGVVKEGIPWLPIFSLIALVIFFIFGKRFFFINKR